MNFAQISKGPLEGTQRASSICNNARWTFTYRLLIIEQDGTNFRSRIVRLARFHSLQTALSDRTLESNLCFSGTYPLPYQHLLPLYPSPFPPRSARLSHPKQRPPLLCPH